MSRAKVAAGFLIAATAVLAWIAVVKFAVAPSFKLDPTTDLSRLYRVELSSLSRTEAPSIVVLGSSRAAFGIDPLTIERRLSLPARSVVNAGFPGFYDVLLEQFVERNADYLRKARIVVIVVDDNAGVYAKVVAAAPAVGYSLPTPGSLLASSVDTVRSWPQPIKRWENSLGAALPDLRKGLYWTARRARESIAYRHREYLWAMTETGRWLWPGVETAVFVENADMDRVSRLIADSYFKNLEFQDEYVRIYERIVKRLDGVQIIAFNMPPALAYAKYRDANYGELHKTQSAAFEAAFRKMRVPYLKCPTAADCGLDESIFADPMHLNADGARRFSTVLTDMLRKFVERTN